MRILVVEDGHEYTDTLKRFAADAAEWERAGSGSAALKRLATPGIDAVFLDMRFDRVDDADLLGDLPAATERFGDHARAVHYLQENQGTIVLQAIRQHGFLLPVLVSYNFDEEPRRWERLKLATDPVSYVPDSAAPVHIVNALRGMIG